MELLKRLFQKKKMQTESSDLMEEFQKRKKAADIIHCNALEVSDFSSQYGSESSISYTASNLAGQGNIYPNYGDFTQACVFRTYGHWWDIAPSKRKVFKRTPPSFCSQDYIELVFPSKLYPLRLDIYETYNPGCVVRILACEQTTDTDVDTGKKPTRWKTLWEGEPVRCPAEPRIFSPPLRKCPFPTDLIRLELCHRLVYYYTELDSVELHGTKYPPDSWEVTGQVPDSKDPDCDIRQVTTTFSNISLNPSSDPSTVIEHVALDTLCQSIDDKPREDGDSAHCDSDDIPEPDNGFFDLMPEEVIQLILSFLDVLSLCRVARTCRLLHQHSYDSLQYTELNLQPHWTQVNDVALDSMHGRSRFLQSLNLSWCHENIISEFAFCSYIQACGSSLRCLYLSSCSFVTGKGLEVIAKSCPYLTELDVDSCKKIVPRAFEHITSLQQIERLNLYRTNIDQESMQLIIVSCPELKHLNIGSAENIKNCDDILVALGEHSRELRSLDVWRCRTVSDRGVKALAEGCPHLEELDIGWCSAVRSTSCSIVELVEKCLKLKKLFLTANRSVCDQDLDAIAKHSRDLEQLDILGTRQVSAEKATEVLKRCEKMVFFDVSFCSGIDDYVVNQWVKNFPHVNVKKSFQNNV